MAQTAFAPESEAEALEAIRLAAANRQALHIRGAGTKDGWGRPVDAECSLDMGRLAGIALYEPEELVLTARAGSSLAEIERRLAQHGQRLAFEPPDLGPLFGAAPGGATLAGIVACNLAGPRRIHAGAARDHVLGFAGINGMGEPFKSGGRVVKNVTGFDLSKLLAGSFGTLAVMTEITLKVMPAAEAARTIVVLGLDPARAVAALGQALSSPHEVSGAAHLPEPIADRSSVVAVARAHTSVTAVRIEGTTESVAARAQGVRGLLAVEGEIAELDAVETDRLWRDIRDVAPFCHEAARAVWQLSVPPASGADAARAILRGVDGEVFFDWGGGRLWLATAADAAVAAAVRHAVAGVGGHATLMRAPAALRRAVPVFQPPSPIEARLARRLKDNFDPHRILNPGRMYEDV